MSASLQCPGCGASLRTATAPSAGARVKCPRCDEAFTVAPEAKRKPAPPAKSAIAAPRPRPRPVPELEAVEPVRGKRRRDDDDDDRPARRGRRPESRQPSRSGLWLGLGMTGAVLVAGLLVLTVILVFFNRPRATEVANAPTPTQPRDPKPVINPEPPPNPGGGGSDGELAADVLERVKKATVYIRVKEANGRGGTGTGFFEATSGMVLTNAHVLGMLKHETPPPTSVEVILNSGLANEVKLKGQIVSVDRSADLALVKVNTAGVADAPQPLTVKPAAGLRETQKVFVFGYPFGESLGKNVTVSTSSVSSLRTEGGLLSKVQVNGGMNPGNSGGPVVDARGNVVGVAVAIISGTQINFAIPGEYVHSIFNGRLAGLSLGEPVRRGGSYVLDARVETIDPMGKLKAITLDYWFAPPGDVGVPSDTEPPLPPGVARGGQVPVRYNAALNTGEAQVTLNSVPPEGQVLYVRPAVTNAEGATRWLPPATRRVEQPPDAKPMTLAFKPKPGTTPVRLTSRWSLQVSRDGEQGAGSQTVDAHMTEQMRVERQSPTTPPVLRQMYQIPKFSVVVAGEGRDRPSAELQRDVDTMKNLEINILLKPNGEIQDRKNNLSRIPPESRETVDILGDQISEAMEVCISPLPGGVVQPGTSWKVPRTFPIVINDFKSSPKVTVDYVYRGTRTVGGRELGVVTLSARLTEPPTREATVSGSIRGVLLIDPATGFAARGNISAEVRVELATRRVDATVEGRNEITMVRGPEALSGPPPR